MQSKTMVFLAVIAGIVAITLSALSYGKLSMLQQSYTQLESKIANSNARLQELESNNAELKRTLRSKVLGLENITQNNKHNLLASLNKKIVKTAADTRKIMQKTNVQFRKEVIEQIITINQKFLTFYKQTNVGFTKTDNNLETLRVFMLEVEKLRKFVKIQEKNGIELINIEGQ